MATGEGTGTPASSPGIINLSTLLTIEEFASDYYMQSTGTIPSHAVQAAINVAEGDISNALGYPVDANDGTPTFIATQVVETHRWPVPNRPMYLIRPRLISLDSVVAMHALECDCDWTEITECAFIHEALTSAIKFVICNRAAGCYSACSCPAQIQITYTSGFTEAQVLPATPLGQRLRQAIALQALTLIHDKDFYTDGGAAVKSYSSMGYSESRDFVRTAMGQRLGLGLLSEGAARQLGPLMIRRAISLRSN